MTFTSPLNRRVAAVIRRRLAAPTIAGRPVSLRAFAQHVGMNESTLKRRLSPSTSKAFDTDECEAIAAALGYAEPEDLFDEARAENILDAA